MNVASRWTDDELAILRSGVTVPTLLRKLDRSEGAIRAAARRHGLTLKEGRRRRRRSLVSPTGCASPELIERFFAEHLHLVKGRFYGQPFRFEDYQRRHIVEPVFGTWDRNGDRTYSEAVLGIPRDGGKSELSAGLCLALMVLEPVHEGEYVVIARNQKQAKLLFEKARKMVLLDPMLNAACDVRTSEIIVKETGQRFYTVPWDAGSVQGIHAQVAIIDEYHVHRNDSVRYAILSGMTHQPNSLLITISTAGSERKGPLWDLLKRAAGDPRAYVKWFGADDEDDIDDPKVWKKANPQSWATVESLRRAFESMPPWEFERYHLNRFPQAKGLIQAFGFELVQKIRHVPDIDPASPVVLGLDVAPRRDRCALVAVQRDEEGVHHWQPWIWEPGAQMDYDDFTGVEERTRLCCEELYVVRIVCDKSFVWMVLNRLKADGYPVEAMTQDNAHMCAVAETLYRLLQAGRIRADDERVHADLSNVRVEERPPWGWRMGKLDDAGYIDSAIAGGMASFVLESDPEALQSSGPLIITG